MIKDEKIVINITNRNRTHFKNKNYNIDSKTTTLEIYTRDLPDTSHQKIIVICELCKNETNLMYYKYLLNKSRHDFYSCKKCSRTKFKMTNVERYGETSYMKTDEGKQKYIDTCMERYGVTNTTLDKNIHKKIQDTMIERYGSNCALMNDDIKIKTEKTMLEKYGAKRYCQSKEFKGRMRLLWQDFYKKKFLTEYNINDYVILDDNTFKIKCEHIDHYYDINYKLLYQRTLLYNVCPCTICNPINNHISGVEIDIYYELLKYVDNIEQTNKSIFGGKHIDLYLPDFKFGIEYNGVYWHSELYNDKYHHELKYNLSIENNIKLFQIFENLWKHNKEDILKLLKNNLLNTFINIEINNLTIKKIKKTDIKLSQIFNYNFSKILYQLFDNNIVIGEIGYNDKNTITYFNWNYDYDCNSIFDIFIKELKLNSYLYIHDNNNVFLNCINLKYIKNIEPDYKYFFLKKKRELILLNKHKINKQFKNNTKTILTEGYLKIYDCGYTKYEI